ncbi:lyase family protein [Arthrobacter sp. EH-1B-1]|uniref:Lyase family protein n=1 Tax=Arthrobacter vasquezii TaxID=2977629 RepID=A0ABT6CUQ8_9MICC|nr:lyase family protein [Arthrobacter vasquezii]MDF9277618.1 lyase family protein [Arthrobacter vasquezii]
MTRVIVEQSIDHPPECGHSFDQSIDQGGSMNTSISTDKQPFSLLTCLYGDAEMSETLSAERLVEFWLKTEQALARAQAQAGVISPEHASAISALTVGQLDISALWDGAQNVGYPILGLVRQMSALLPEGANGRVHFAATTQDIMDTGTVLQVSAAADLLLKRVQTVGNLLAAHTREHRSTVMAGRTHGQQAVPTTFGAHLAPLLAEFTRAISRLESARHGVAKLSLYGAGGTSAAAGESSRKVRALMAEELSLAADDVPWHTSRDSLIVLGQVASLLASACARLARNVIDLSRTEIAEIQEAAGLHRGASSTMPQKANPILAEGIIGMSAVVAPLVSSLARASEIPQERAAGEWQIEWHVLPQVLLLSSSCLTASAELLDGLRVDSVRMRENLNQDGGLIMAEAYMFQLAGALGRETAHDIVYAAARDVRDQGGTLGDAVAAELSRQGHAGSAVSPIDPSDYLGEAANIADMAVRQWKEKDLSGFEAESASFEVKELV